MGDWTLTIDGDPSGGVAALQRVGEETTTLHKQATSMGDAQRKQSEEFWAGVTKAAAAAAAAITAFGVASVKAFMEAERIQKQLVRATGEYAERLSAQADAMESVLNVDAEVIKQSQTLLAQWGGVGAASEDVTRAVLDYAAATGKDAVTATQELIRNVESGGVGLAKLGVHFDATGNKGEDLSRMVAALGKKFGGAAAADADSLHGQVEGVRIGFGNLMEDFGQFIAQIAAKTGVIEKVSDAIKSWREIMFGNPEEEKRQENLQLLEAINGRLEHRKVLLAELQRASDEGSTATIAQAQAFFVANEKAIAQLKAQRDAHNAAITGGLPGLGSVTGDTNKGMKEGDAAIQAAEAHAAKMTKLQDKNLEDFREYQKGIDEVDEHARKKDEDDYAHELAASAKRVELAQKEADDKGAILQLSIAKDLEAEEKRGKEMAKLEHKALMDQQERVAKKEKEARAAGDAIGAAMVNALADQLAKLAAGGEFDAAMFISEILAAAVGVAGTVIGTAFGQPAVGAAIGNLAAMGIRAGGSAISKGNKSNGPRTMHEGGWVDAPRYHSGGPLGPDEVPIIGQTGEFMWSRQMVQNAGGPAAVESMARSGRGGGVTFNVHAIDAKSFADTMAGTGGDGLKQALRRGHGALPALLGRSPR